MSFENESPLVGWKEILPALGVRDKRSAKKILEEKKLLHYEGRLPVLMFSEYLNTLRAEKNDLHQK